jgi:diacylglycerol O-acyltransferase / wax synthase
MSARLSTADTAWLHMGARQADHLQRLVDRYPRFRPRVVESRLPLRAPRWEDDPDFALEHHVHHFALHPPGDRAALQALVGDLMTTALDRHRPLWHMYLIDGFGSGAAIINRMHHCIADGIALARVMLSLTDSDPDAGMPPHVPEPPRARSAGILRGLAPARPPRGCC